MRWNSFFGLEHESPFSATRCCGVNAYWILATAMAIMAGNIRSIGVVMKTPIVG